MLVAVGGAPDDGRVGLAVHERLLEAVPATKATQSGADNSHPDFFVYRLIPNTSWLLTGADLDDLHRLSPCVLTVRLVLTRGLIYVHVAHAARADRVPAPLYRAPVIGARAWRRRPESVLETTDWTGITHPEDRRVLASLIAAVNNMHGDMPVLSRWLEHIGARGKTVKGTSGALVMDDDSEATLSVAGDDETVGFALAFAHVADVESPFLKHLRDEHPTLTHVYAWHAPAFADKLFLLVLNVRRFLVTSTHSVRDALVKHRVRGDSLVVTGKKRKE